MEMKTQNTFTNMPIMGKKLTLYRKFIRMPAIKLGLSRKMQILGFHFLRHFIRNTIE